MIDDETPDHPGGEGEEIRATLPLDARLIDELEIVLVAEWEGRRTRGARAACAAITVRTFRSASAVRRARAISVR